MLCGVAANQLIEIALLAAGGCVLHQQGQAALVKLLEPLVPVNVLQRLLTAESRKIQANHAHIFSASGSPHASRIRIALFRPLANFVVISQHARL